MPTDKPRFTSTDGPPPSVVLDTNVVLDWLLFRDANARPIGAAIDAGRCRWIGTEAMTREFDDVVGRPGLARWHTHVDAARVAIARRCVRVDAAPVAALLCSDSDDQKFIDLAIACRAGWLFSRDKALLRLARRAAAWDLRVLHPADPGASALVANKTGG